MVICDDEKIIRDGISGFIKSEFENIEIAAVFSDGLSCIDYLHKFAVDIIISDIRMKNSDGLEIAEYVYTNELSTSVILITGFRQFDYALKAISFKADAFITKPIDFGELKNAIRDVINKIDSITDIERKNSDDTVALHKHIRDTLFNYYHGEISAKALEDFLLSEKPKILDSPTLLVSLFAVDDKKPLDVNDPKQVWSDFADIEAEDYSFYTLIANNKSCSIAVILNGKEEKSRGKAEEYISTLEKNIYTIYGVEFIHTEIELNSIKDLYRSNENYFTELYRNAVISGDTNELKRLETDMTKSLSFNQISTVINDICLWLNQNYNCDTDTLKRKTALAISKEDICLELQGLRIICEDLKSFIPSLVSRSLDYIQSNYDKEISLEDISSMFNVSKSYFSRLFKKETGKNFKDYVTCLKINEAKNLLKTGKYTVKEVAYKVGFNNPLYFGQIFKKFVGMTPQNYIVFTNEIKSVSENNRKP